MTRTISLIIGITVLALAAVPAAFGEGRLAGSDQQTAAAQQSVQLDRRTDAFDRTAAVSPSSTYRDAADRVVTPSSNPGYVDANERGGVPRAANSDYVDANQRGAVPSEPNIVASTGSGTEVDWPQIGIGFGLGIGIALALGLGLAITFRPSRQRPLAH
jgi:hypothetical protein